MPVSEKAAGCGGHDKCRPGGEDHLKRRRRLRRIVPSPPVPPSPWLPALLIGGKCFCRFCGELAMPKARPCRMPDWQVEPVSPGQAPPTGTCLASSVSAAGGLMQGCRGRSPPSPIKTARNPRPQSGRGRSRPARSGSSGNADYISIPMFLFSASSSEQRQQRQRSAEPQRHLRR